MFILVVTPLMAHHRHRHNEVAHCRSELNLIVALEDFCYVTLGGFSPALHEHVYTGNKSTPILDRVLTGQFVTFSKREPSQLARRSPSRHCRMLLNTAAACCGMNLLCTAV